MVKLNYKQQCKTDTTDKSGKPSCR